MRYEYLYSIAEKDFVVNVSYLLSISAQYCSNLLTTYEKDTDRGPYAAFMTDVQSVSLIVLCWLFAQ